MRLTASIAALLFAIPARGALYSTMAPVNQYLMDRHAEIEMAKSAAPRAIGNKARIMVLTRRGYDIAIKGSNGLVCAVERSWMSNYDFPEFWNPHIRGAICFNPAAVRTILPYTIRRTELVLAGRSIRQMSTTIGTEIRKGRLPHLENGAVTYMMSKQSHLNDIAHNWVPHLMFYFPRAEGSNWASGLPGVPTMLNEQFQESPEAISVIMVPVTHWSDGTRARRQHRRLKAHRSSARLFLGR